MAAQNQTIVLITGANQGIGFETAKKLAKENPGYHVLMGSRDAARGTAAAAKLKAEGLDVEAIAIDVGTDESIVTAASEVATKFGRLDVLINNADVMLKGFNTNVFGAMQCFETFKPLLEKSENPRVVFISSSLASFGVGASWSPGEYPIYRSTKSAMNTIVLQYAHLYREKGFKINLCCPGYVASNLNSYAGTGTLESGAINPVRLATLGKDGETGTFSNKEGPLPW
ncbi:unnamed protein product [Diplocarpon coronariae]